MTGTFTRRPYGGGTRWTPDFHTQEVIDTSRTLQAVINALAVTCPECGRVRGNACVIPAGLEHMGVFLHHERIAAGDSA